ncbi:MAG TPA: PH domain-containing protein [Marmoricola sp.]
METTAITSWTLQPETSIPDVASTLLAQGEEAVAATKTSRDSAVFTAKRLIVHDAHGLTGRKVTP